jgi:hypothetical protein
LNPDQRIGAGLTDLNPITKEDPPTTTNTSKDPRQSEPGEIRNRNGLVVNFIRRHFKTRPS